MARFLLQSMEHPAAMEYPAPFPSASAGNLLGNIVLLDAANAEVGA